MTLKAELVQACAPPVKRRLRLSALARRRLVGAVRLTAATAIAVWALATPGFLTPLSLFSMLTAISFVGCVATGMTFITLTGNILSLCLGATLATAAMVFLVTMKLGVGAAFTASVLYAAAVTGIQGVIIGYFRANAILVSIAFLSLFLGFSQIATVGDRVYPTGSGFEIFKAKIHGMPIEAIIFLAAAAFAQVILSWTSLGRAMRMVGSNRRAAEAAGLRCTFVVTMAYVLAGVFTALAGVLLASRYGSADMDLGTGYDYNAIAAVLVGGTAIQGGAGSAVRTLIGVIVISTIHMVLRLRGFSDQWQYLITGLIVLAVIMLQTVGERR